MTIATKILSGDLYEAKNKISERLNEHVLNLLEATKTEYARTLFAEDFDAKPKGKTDVDMARDAEKESGNDEEDTNDDNSDDDSDDDGDSDDKSDDDDNDKDDDATDDEDDNKKKKSMKGGKSVTINVKEETEINEISKGLAGRYINKAATNANWQGFVIGNRAHKVISNTTADTTDPDYKAMRDAERKGNNRKTGIGMAVKKLTKESEDLQELSRGKLAKYIGRSSVALRNSAFKSGHKFLNDDEGYSKDSKESTKRQIGIQRAAKKLAKEEVEQDIQEKDMFHKGKNFSKIAASAGKKYGSPEAGKRVAGAILKKMRAGHVKGGVKE